VHVYRCSFFLSVGVLGEKTVVSAQAVTYTCNCIVNCYALIIYVLVCTL